MGLTEYIKKNKMNPPSKKGGFEGLIRNKVFSQDRSTFGSIDPIDYEQDITNDDYLDPDFTYQSPNDPDEIRANRQSWTSKAATGVARVGVRAGAEIAKMPGVVGGVIAAIGAEEGEGWETFVNNGYIKAINEFTDDVNKELLPVYSTEAYHDGNVIEKISSVDFWATEGADGVGFIASMLMPGAAFKALGAGSKLTNVAQLSNRVGNLQRAASITPQMIDNALITAGNTLFEAAAEAGGAMDNFQNELDQKLKNGQINFEEHQELSKQKALLGRDIFTMNMAILAVPNMINTKLLYGGVKSNIGKEMYDIAGKLRTNIKTPSALSGLKSVGKLFGQNLLAEGFVEEGLQMTAENMLTESALKGELTNAFLNDFNTNELADSYLHMLTTTEGQSAIALGGILGTTVQGRSTYKNSIKSKNEAKSLLEEGRRAVELYGATNINPDIYLRDESGEYILEDGKRKINPIKRNELISKQLNSENLSKIYDEASKLNDTETLQFLQELGENNLINKFMGDPENAGEHVKAFLSEDDKMSATRKQSIIDKAEYIGKKQQEFLDFSGNHLRVQNDTAKDEDYQSFFERLNHKHIFDETELFSKNKKLDIINEKLTSLNIPISSIDELDVKDIRVTDLVTEKKKLEQDIENIKKSSSQIWNPNVAQKAFDLYIKDNNKLRENETPEKIIKVDKITKDIDTSTTVAEVNDATSNNPKTELTADEMFGAGTSPVNVINEPLDEGTTAVIDQQADNKKAEIVEKDNIKAEEKDNEMNLKLSADIQEKVDFINEGLKNKDTFTIKVGPKTFNSKGDGILYIEYKTIDDKSFPTGTNIQTTFEKAFGIKADEPIDNVENKTPQEKEDDSFEVSEIDNEFNSKPLEVESKDSAFPTVKLLGLYVDNKLNKFNTEVSFLSDKFLNWVKSINNKVGTMVTFELATANEIKNSNRSKDAIELLNKDNKNYTESELETLHRYLPIKVITKDYGYTFINTLSTNKEGKYVVSTDSQVYVSRQNIVNAIVKHGIDNISSEVQYQKSAPLNYIKGGNINNNISHLEEFKDEPQNVDLYFGKDDLSGTLSADTEDKLPQFVEKAKGMIFTVITDHKGDKRTVSLNSPFLNESQAVIIYNIYSALNNYNKVSDSSLTQENAKLETLYTTSPELKQNVEDILGKELEIFKSKKDITVGDLMNTLIHDNDNSEFMLKLRGGGIVFGNEGKFVNFDNVTEDFKENLTNFLTLNKRRNIKLNFLRGRNDNIDPKIYKSYLINDVLTTNLDVDTPFLGEIDLYIDSNVQINSTSTKSTSNQVENNLENPLILENKSLSSQSTPGGIGWGSLDSTLKPDDDSINRSEKDCKNK